MRKNMPELRVLGTSVTLTEAMRRRAEQDLGLRIRFEVLDGFDAQRQAVMRQDSFDLYDQWFHSLDCLWPTGALQPIDIGRLAHWDEVNALPKTGRITPQAALGAGCNPAMRLYVQADGTLGGTPASRISMLPLTHNADSFVYLPAAVPDLFAQTEESWSWLLSPACRGRAALQADAAIGALDAALALQAGGDMRFGDISNLGLEEIDQMMALLLQRQESEQFRGFWGNYADAARLMIDACVAIQSHWSPAIAHYRAAGLDYRLACPREGYRAWYGGLGISSQARGETLDAAYRYLNWWQSGWPGAAMARQGYYISNPLRSREHLRASEWDYWYAGLPAAEDLRGTDGQILIPRGSVRDGGSYEQRLGHIAVWNTVMDEHNYLVRQWATLLRRARPL
ncbi:extracellular solute-binding protein [Delftia tsuruhatensis]|uniref:ABC transporter substrate-binding protein n=1 Tax=Delftia tsuruhatensis TaxID=180282 RepID=UPI001054F86D|nr:extracellular solute-binding protein [Delftia tsuruhatensis]TDF24022.1 extracellular solute-binding protein [Delftia tsuruhatensis]